MAKSFDGHHDVVLFRMAPIIVRNIVESSESASQAKSRGTPVRWNVVSFSMLMFAGARRPADNGDMTSRTRMFIVDVKKRAQLRTPLFLVLLQASNRSFHQDLEGKQSVLVAEAPL